MRVEQGKRKGVVIFFFFFLFLNPSFTTLYRWRLRGNQFEVTGELIKKKKKKFKTRQHETSM